MSLPKFTAEFSIASYDSYADAKEEHENFDSPTKIEPAWGWCPNAPPRYTSYGCWADECQWVPGGEICTREKCKYMYGDGSFHVCYNSLPWLFREAAPSPGTRPVEP